MIFTFIFAIWVCKEEVEDYHVNGFFASWYFLFSFSISVFFFLHILGFEFSCLFVDIMFLLCNVCSFVRVLGFV